MLTTAKQQFLFPFPPLHELVVPFQASALFEAWPEKEKGGGGRIQQADEIETPASPR